MIFIKKNTYTVLLIIILLVGLFIRVKLSQDDFLHKWDERYHALVAKNLINEPLKPTLYKEALLNYDYKNWYNNHIWLHKQPLPLWLIATSYKLFGISEFATRLPSLIFSIFAIVFTYLLGNYFFNKKIGLLAAFFFAINGLIIEIGSGRVATDHYDLLFLVFIEAAILFAYLNSLNKKYVFSVLSGAFIGFALLTKWMPALIVLPIHYFLLTQKESKTFDTIKQISISIITCLFLFLPWQFYILNNFPLEAKWEYYHNWLHISTELDGQTGGYLYYLEAIRINYSEIIYLPLIYLVYKLYRSKWKDKNLIVLALWIFIPIIFFSLAKTKMQGYILFISPALFILTAKFFFDLKSELIPSFQNKYLIFTSKLLLIAIIILPIRYCFERTQFGFTEQKSTDYEYSYKKISNKFNDKCVVLNVSNPIEFMFYNNCIAYSVNKISEKEVEQIKLKGYTILHYNPSLGIVQ